jgi:hypothetical protein
MLKFVLLDKGIPYIIHEGDLSKGSAHYNGITWDKANVYLSATENTRYGIRIFNRQLVEISNLFDADLHETHQILWKRDKLYATNTGLNRIEIWDGKEWSHKAFNPSTCDVDHINAIWSKDEYFYIGEFRRRQSENEKSRVRFCNSDFSLRANVIVDQPIHNVYIEDGSLYNLVSGDIYGISKIDLESGKQNYYPLFQSKVLLRGLARTESFWYIGVSRWETERDKRHVGDAIILQLDNDFKEVDRIIMLNFGPVCDIRVIDELDLAHNGVGW